MRLEPRFYFEVDGETAGKVTFPSDGELLLDFAVARSSSSRTTRMPTGSGSWEFPGDTATTGLWTRGSNAGSRERGQRCELLHGAGAPAAATGENDVDGGTTISRRRSTGPWSRASSPTGGTPTTPGRPRTATSSRSTSPTTGTPGRPSRTSTRMPGPGVQVLRDRVPHHALRRHADRFIASDLGDGSLVEAAIDVLVVGGVQCEDAPPTCVRTSPATG